MKKTNPKTEAASSKLPLQLFPATAIAAGAVGMLDGALKYGRSNYLVDGVKASEYVAAEKRHMDAWMSGENCNLEGVPHLASALSCIAILIDAEYAGVLEDDRMVANGYDAAIAHLEEVAANLKQLHADKFPKHYTIQDN